MTDETKALTNTVLAVVLIAVVLVMGIYINSTIELAVDADNTAGAAVNESITPTDAGVNLAAASLRNGACGTVTYVGNGTIGPEISSGNYTITGCSVVNTTSEFTDTAWVISYPYTYSADTAASNASADAVAALGNGTPWLTIVVVIAFAVIVLGFLLSGFKGANASEGQLTY